MGKKQIDDDLAIRGFADAALTAMGLHERFGFCHAVACLEEDGQVVDLTMFTDPELHDVDTALEWAYCLGLNESRFCRLVVFSTGVAAVTEPSEGDLALFRLMRRIFREDGIEVVDWIRCDGENVRSLALTERSDAWGGEADDGAA